LWGDGRHSPGLFRSFVIADRAQPATGESMRLTRFGAVVLVVLAVCAVTVVVASGALQALAVAVGGLVLAMIAGEGIGSGFSNPDATLGRIGEFARKREVLRRYARRRHGKPPEDR
jgi:hypothetical protein